MPLNTGLVRYTPGIFPVRYSLDPVFVRCSSGPVLGENSPEYRTSPLLGDFSPKYRTSPVLSGTAPKPPHLLAGPQLRLAAHRTASLPAGRQPATAATSSCSSRHRPPQRPGAGAFDASRRRARSCAKNRRQPSPNFDATAADAARPKFGRPSCAPRHREPRCSTATNSASLRRPAPAVRNVRTASSASRPPVSTTYPHCGTPPPPLLPLSPFHPHPFHPLPLSLRFPPSSSLPLHQWH